MYVTGEFSIIYMALVGIILLRHKIDAIFENLSTIYKDGHFKEGHSLQFLTQVNMLSEWMWKIYFKCIAAVVIINAILAPSMSIFYGILMNKENSNVTNFFHPIPLMYVFVRKLDDLL